LWGIAHERDEHVHDEHDNDDRVFMRGDGNRDGRSLP